MRHSLSNIHLVDDGRVLDWYAERAATDALDAVRHENAADMICVLAIDLTRHLILCKIDLLGGEDVVVVAAVGAAISATPGAHAARRTKTTQRPAAGKLLTNLSTTQSWFLFCNIEACG